MTASVSAVPAATLWICLVDPFSEFPTDTPLSVGFQVATILFALALSVAISVLTLINFFSLSSIWAFTKASLFWSVSSNCLYKSIKSLLNWLSVISSVCILVIKASYFVLSVPNKVATSVYFPWESYPKSALSWVFE